MRDAENKSSTNITIFRHHAPHALFVRLDLYPVNYNIEISFGDSKLQKLCEQQEDENVDWLRVTAICIIFIGDYHD